MQTTSLSKRLPSLDGWRALSILLVLALHTRLASPGQSGRVVALLSDGNLGVRFFFVISGFLITWLLLQEANHSGKVSLKNFYLRRAFRILPVYFAFLLVLALLQSFTAFRETVAGWTSLLTFTRNFINGAPGSGHLWSLSVEEQFYLLWPALFVLAYRQGERALTALLLLPILTAPLFRVGNYIYFLPHMHVLQGPHLSPPAWLAPLINNASFFCYDDSLAFGCLTAVLLMNHQRRMTEYFQNWRISFLSAGVALVLFPATLLTIGVSGFPRFFCQTCGHSLQAAGFCLLIIQSLVLPDWHVYRPLNWKWVAWIGVLSYSLYIWQQPFYFRIWEGNDFWRTHPNAAWAHFAIIPALAVAVLSYYGLERPFLRLRSRFRPA